MLNEIILVVFVFAVGFMAGIIVVGMFYREFIADQRAQIEALHHTIESIERGWS